eukprot:UN24966
MLQRRFLGKANSESIHPRVCPLWALAKPTSWPCSCQISWPETQSKYFTITISSKMNQKSDPIFHLYFRYRATLIQLFFRLVFSFYREKFK